MTVDERTFEAYRVRVTELERDMEAVQDDVRALYRFCRVVVLCFAVLVVLYSACIIGLVMS